MRVRAAQVAQRGAGDARDVALRVTAPSKASSGAPRMPFRGISSLVLKTASLYVV
jgi:uncharacterized membrane protein